MLHRPSIICALATSLLLGCGVATPSPRWDAPASVAPVTRAQINTTATLRRDYMRYGGEREALPYRLDPTLVMDEALISELSRERTCLLVTVRTDATYDAPVAESKPTCLVDDREVTGEVVGEEETASLEQWWQERDVGFDPSAMQVTASTEGRDHMLQIVSRVAKVCCPDAPYERLELRLTHPLLGLPPREIYRLKLIWEIEVDDG